MLNVPSERETMHKGTNSRVSNSNTVTTRETNRNTNVGDPRES